MLFEKTFQGVDTSLIEELITEEELLGPSNPAILYSTIKYKIVAKILLSKRSNGLGISCPLRFRIPLHLGTRRIMHGCFARPILTSQALIRGTELTPWLQVIPSLNVQSLRWSHLGESGSTITELVRPHALHTKLMVFSFLLYCSISSPQQAHFIPYNSELRHFKIISREFMIH